jgi:steroid 5-alpha reductase family enzyme
LLSSLTAEFKPFSWQHKCHGVKHLVLTVKRLIMSLSIGLSMSFISFWCVALFSNAHVMVDLLLVNAVIQVTLFIVVACIPFLRTGRMSYVDIAWPFGVALIGILIILMADGDIVRKLVVAGVYLFIGLRMGIGALVMAKTTGVIFKSEFPRYQYRRMIIDKSGTENIKFHMLVEIMVQAFANISVLALPGFIIASNNSHSISPLEIIGICIWGTAYIFESIADGQKMLFISRNKQGVCNTGLWRYSRHPNYFAEWMVWTGLVIAAIPSWWALSGAESTPVWIALGLGALNASIMMYITLVYLTGATPAEYYSVRKRSEYKAYQEKTSVFFPWFPSKRL